MLTQEEIYRHIFNKEWEPIIMLLHKHRSLISNDALLTQSAIVFEEEFFKDLKDVALEDQRIISILEYLYVLHTGKFYLLQGSHYYEVLRQLVLRLDLKRAHDYARLIPDDADASKIISQFEHQIAEQNLKEIASKTPANWVEIFNRLFELLDKKDKPTYFSGPRFINVVQEFSPYFPDYNQYIQLRTNEGKSTTRKIYYYDILTELDKATKSKVISRYLDHLRPFAEHEVQKIEELLGWRVNQVASARTTTVEANETKEMNKKRPIVFISYSWDDELHKQWVLDLAQRLSDDGVEVILDRYELRPGRNLPYFVETSISRAHRIIIVFTPNYKLKADKRTGGVGYEYSIINADLYKNQTTNEKVIPVLRRGSQVESIPQFMHQLIHIDISNDENFGNSYLDLIREIHDEPAILRPAIGDKPLFK